MRYIWLVALALLFTIITPAWAHDWFKGTVDPVSKSSCCDQTSSNPDCAAVPAFMMEAGVIEEVPEGYHVRLTIEQARYFYAPAQNAIDEVVKWERVQPGLSNGFAMCVRHKVLCFFSASNV